jgi:hypothetical protein
VNPAASSKRPCKGEKKVSSLDHIDEGQGSCVELGTTVKNLPA